MLQNSFLDRLIDEELDVESENRKSIPELLYDIEKSISRDVTNLLNTQNYHFFLPPFLQELIPSLLDYGMPYYIENLSIEGQSQAEIVNSMNSIINRYEPRLKFTEISYVETPYNKKNILSFSLKGTLPTRFSNHLSEFIIELETKSYNISLKRL